MYHTNTKCRIIDYSRRNMNIGKRSYLFGVILLFMLILASIIFITKTVTAERTSAREKLVTSVQIKKGDSLWSIANTYITEEYRNINEYIEEIKTSNGLSTDTIHAGNYIIVPYYADAGNRIRGVQ
ncbi:MAG: LysM peptidoglycan-binding domain-containing protein [Clostridiales bacterium]|nr:LysM peptidoglycan-binding domain-containing protein [Clostridiales bacterium]